MISIHADVCSFSTTSSSFRSRRFERHDGVQVFACGKMVDQPTMRTLISACGRHYLERLITIAQQIFPEPPSSA